jgi:pimeloyl-ACP methyl ester carboxylesterase
MSLYAARVDMKGETMNRVLARLCLVSLCTVPLASGCKDEPDSDVSHDAALEDAGNNAQASDDAGDAGDVSVGDAGDAGAADASDGAASSDGAVVVFPATPSASGRVQDTREFTFATDTARFDALPGVSIETDRLYGTYEGGAYRIEIPKTWNGKLVAYAHGYVGPVPALRVTTPSIRRYLIEKGFAWVASSYSRNYYDVRAGVEDTNRLVHDFVSIAKKHGVTVAEPTKRYIVGHSMGGHVTAAAIEKEAADTAQNKVSYDGALPMCGVMGDTELFNYFAAYQTVAMHLTGMPASAWPVPDFAAKRPALQAAVFSMYPKVVTDVGVKVRSAVMNLTGGKRPVFELGFAGMSGQDAVWGTFGGDGTLAGILEKNVNDTRDIKFQLSDPALQAEETALNAAIYRVTPAADANPLRPGGLRFIPKVNGEISIKVLSMHTLGDLYVPFKMQQIYRQRVEAKGNADKLVQRAIRGMSHCEFTYSEQVTAFEALVAWVENGTKPEGDEVLDAAVVGQPNYGCKFTSTSYSADEMTAGTLPAARAMLPACTTP